MLSVDWCHSIPLSLQIDFDWPPTDLSISISLPLPNTLHLSHVSLFVFDLLSLFFFYMKSKWNCFAFRSCYFDAASRLLAYQTREERCRNRCHLNRCSRTWLSCTCCRCLDWAWAFVCRLHLSPFFHLCFFSIVYSGAPDSSSFPLAAYRDAHHLSCVFRQPPSLQPFHAVEQSTRLDSTRFDLIRLDRHLHPPVVRPHGNALANTPTRLFSNDMLHY